MPLRQILSMASYVCQMSWSSCPRVGRDKIVSEKQWLTYPFKSLCQHNFEIYEVEASFIWATINVLAGLTPAKALKKAECDWARAQWALARWDLQVELGFWWREKNIWQKSCWELADLREEGRKGPVGRRIRGWVWRRRGSVWEGKYEWDGWVRKWSTQEMEEDKVILRQKNWNWSGLHKSSGQATMRKCVCLGLGWKKAYLWLSKEDLYLGESMRNVVGLGVLRTESLLGN